MSIFFRNWLDEGYYEEDSSGDLRKLDNEEDIKNAIEEGTLYQHDGYSFSKCNDDINLEDILNDLNKKYK